MPHSAKSRDTEHSCCFCDLVSYGRHVTDYQYHMNHCGSDIAVEKLSNRVDLGVNFDDKLSFKDHYHG